MGGVGERCRHPVMLLHDALITTSDRNDGGDTMRTATLARSRCSSTCWNAGVPRFSALSVPDGAEVFSGSGTRYGSTRPLDHIRFPHSYLDATYCKARVNHQIVSRSVAIATGIAEDGGREVPGL
jgi:hypothetical protein